MPALLLPGIGDVLVFYAPPLVVAQLLGAFARNEPLTMGMLTPYVLTFTALWFAGEVVWRAAEALITRSEIRGIESLYVEAMDELLAKDLAFFHDNFAGSLTKRTLGYARRFEDVFDVLSFQVIAKIVPLAFVTVVLWRYSPWLILVLLGMLSITVALVVPRIRRRRRLVDEREAASNVLAGHVADSIANAEAVRAFARERDEAAIHAANVRDFGRKTLRSWDYQNFRVNTITAPMYVLTNTLGLVVALHVSLGSASSLETVFLTFSYFATATRVMWEFNRIYRNLEGALTDAAQFADLLLDPPSVQDLGSPVPFAPRDHSVEVRDISFRHSPAQPLLFDRFSLAVPAGTKLGLVGRSGGGKTTITRLLLRFRTSSAGRFSSAASRSPMCLNRHSARPSRMCRRIPRCSTVPSPTTSASRGRGPPTKRSAAPRCSHTPRSSSSRCRTATTRSWVNAASSSPAASASASRSRARILKDAPILIDESRRRARSTPRAKRYPGRALDADGRIAPRSSSRTASPPSAAWTRSSSSTAAGSSAGERTNLLALGGIYASLWSHQSGGLLPATDVESVAGRLTSRVSVLG